MSAEPDCHDIGLLSQKLLRNVLDISSEDLFEAFDRVGCAIDHNRVDALDVRGDEFLDVHFMISSS